MCKSNQRLVWMMATVVLLALAAMSLRAGILYVMQFRVEAAIDHWYATPAVKPSVDEIRAMEAEAASLLAWDEADPDMQTALGRLYYFHATRLLQPGPPADALMQQALDHFRAVVRLRPAWAYGQINLFTAKAQLRQFDAESERALRSTIALGPWDNTILPALVQWSVWSWAQLTPDTQAEAKRYLLLAAEKRAGDVGQALSGSGRLNYFCHAIAFGEAQPTLCR